MREKFTSCLALSACAAFVAATDAFFANRKVPPAPYVAEANGGIAEFNGTAAASAANAFVVSHDIRTTEHMPLTYTLSKDAQSGAVTIRYSEPAGFPVKFHWDATIGLDGTAVTTQMVVEPPPQQQQQ